jgi:anti-sigma factor RsiW
MFVPHLAESTLEEYALGRLSRYRVDRVHDHLEKCESCRERLLREIAAVTAMKLVAKRIRSNRRRPTV